MKKFSFLTTAFFAAIVMLFANTANVNTGVKAGPDIGCNITAETTTVDLANFENYAMQIQSEQDGTIMQTAIQEKITEIAENGFPFDTYSSTMPGKDVQYGAVQTVSADAKIRKGMVDKAKQDMKTDPTSLNQEITMKILPTIHGVASFSASITFVAKDNSNALPGYNLNAWTATMTRQNLENQRVFPLTSNSSTAIAACKVVVISTTEC